MKMEAVSSIEISFLYTRLHGVRNQKTGMLNSVSTVVRYDIHLIASTSTVTCWRHGQNGVGGSCSLNSGLPALVAVRKRLQSVLNELLDLLIKFSLSEIKNNLHTFLSLCKCNGNCLQDYIYKNLNFSDTAFLLFSLSLHLTTPFHYTFVILFHHLLLLFHLIIAFYDCVWLFNFIIAFCYFIIAFHYCVLLFSFIIAVHYLILLFRFIVACNYLILLLPLFI